MHAPLLSVLTSSLFPGPGDYASFIWGTRVLPYGRLPPVTVTGFLLAFCDGLLTSPLTATPTSTLHSALRVSFPKHAHDHALPCLNCHCVSTGPAG